MSLVERLRKIMETQYGITTNEQLMQAIEDIEDQGGIDIGIFCAPFEPKQKEEKEIA